MNAVQHILMLGVRLYRWVISPAKTLLFGPLGRCRFTPSCSEYALDAIRTHGALRGSWLAVRRICRCHPWGGCGDDPVPPWKSEVRSPKSESRKPNPSLAIGARTFRTSDFGLRTSSVGSTAHSQGR